MGNGHSGDEGSKPPDTRRPRQQRQTITNTPYLKSLFQKLARKSDDTSSEGTHVTQQIFEDAFNGPLRVLGKLLFTHIKAHGKNARRASIHLEEFLRVSSDVMSVLTNTQQLNYYYDVFSQGKDLSLEGIYHMVQVAYAVSLVVAYLPFEQTSNTDHLLRALAVGMMGANESIDKAEFVSWCSKHIPHIFNGVHSFLLIKLSGAEFDDMSWHQRMSQAKGKGNLSELSLAMIACLEDGSGASLTPCVTWLLASSLPNLYVIEQQKSNATRTSIVPNFLMSRMQSLTEKNPWCQLYCSNRDGLSVNRFEHHVYAYKGPTVALFSFENNLYALATDCEWRESISMWGSEGTVLMQLLPRFSFIDSGRIVYTNHHTRGVFKGIQIGSDYKSPVIKIADMATVEHYDVDLTLEQVEVWGCANNSVRETQLKQRAWERKEVEKIHNRKLKLENWEENPDRMLLDWVGINTNHNQRV